MTSDLTVWKPVRRPHESNVWMILLRYSSSFVNILCLNLLSLHYFLHRDPCVSHYFLLTTEGSREVR